MKRDDLVSAILLWGRSRNREFWQKKKTTQRLLDNGPNTVSHASLKEDWNRLLEQEEARFKQQAKCFWLKNGNRNTKSFHAQINGRRKMDRITKLKESSGTWIEDEQEIKNHVLHYFQSISYGGSVDCERVFKLVLPLISDADNADLCAPFSNE